MQEVLADVEENMREGRPIYLARKPTNPGCCNCDVAAESAPLRWCGENRLGWWIRDEKSLCATFKGWDKFFAIFGINVRPGEQVCVRLVEVTPPGHMVKNWRAGLPSKRRGRKSK